MNFFDAVKAVYSDYATFSGRARRSEYWWWVLFQLIVGLGISGLAYAMGMAQEIGTDILSLIWALLNLIPGLAVGVRRLHDTDRSGWWLLIGLVPLIGLILLIVWFCTRGTAGPNRFGSDPQAA